MSATVAPVRRSARPHRRTRSCRGPRRRGRPPAIRSSAKTGQAVRAAERRDRAALVSRGLERLRASGGRSLFAPTAARSFAQAICRSPGTSANRNVPSLRDHQRLHDRRGLEPAARPPPRGSPRRPLDQLDVEAERRAASVTRSLPTRITLVRSPDRRGRGPGSTGRGTAAPAPRPCRRSFPRCCAEPRFRLPCAGRRRSVVGARSRCRCCRALPVAQRRGRSPEAGMRARGPRFR